jgi:hypothetical protein
MEHPAYPDTSRELHQKCRELAPDAYAAFKAFSQQAFADGAPAPHTRTPRSRSTR